MPRTNSEPLLVLLLAVLPTASCGKLPPPPEAPTPTPADAPVGLDASDAGLDVLAAAAADPSARAVALIFTDPECPISNRLAPALRSLGDDFAETVRFYLVYPDPTVTAAEIEAHVRDYGYGFPTLRDPDYRLVETAGATVYSEVAVFDPEGRLLYRGRVNDQFVDFGVTRPRPTREDLRLALESVVGDRQVETSRTRAIGCYIPPRELVAAGEDAAVDPTS